MQRRKDQNYDRQLKALEGPEPLSGEIPLAHLAPAWVAKEIMKVGKLVTKKCRVFNTDLIYFFAIKPAYRTKIGAEESHQLSRFPVAFILKQSSLKNPRHVYPFDTGGAADGAFDSKADPYVPLEDYALSPEFSAVSNFIGWAFGNKIDYYDGRLRNNLSEETQPFQSVAVSYIDIARMGVVGSNEHDTRASTIEISSNHNIELAGALHLIIAPKQFVEGNEPVLELMGPLKKSGAELKLYDWQPNRAPNEYQDDIMRIARAWYEQKKIL